MPFLSIQIFIDSKITLELTLVDYLVLLSNQWKICVSHKERDGALPE